MSKGLIMEDLASEIQRLRDELEKKKAEVDDLRKLVKAEIDREFPPDLEAFSEKELDTFVRELIISIKDFTETRPDLKPITSHRKTIGRPIVLLKRALLETTFHNLESFLDKQMRFNNQAVDLARALFLRLERQRERMKQIEDRIVASEESLVILKDRLEALRDKLDEVRTTGHSLK